jgi:hypothetical protein
MPLFRFTAPKPSANLTLEMGKGFSGFLLWLSIFKQSISTAYSGSIFNATAIAMAHSSSTYRNWR